MSLRRTIAWSTAMRDHRRERVAPNTSIGVFPPMFARSLARAREIDARRAERRAALEAERRAASASGAKCEEVNKL